MQWFANLKIRVKLLAGFGIVAILAGVVGMIGVSNLRSVNTNYTDLFNLYGRPLGDVGRAGIQFEKIRSNIRDLAINHASGAQQRAVASMQQSEKKMKEYLTVYEKSLQTAKYKALYSEFTELLAQFDTIREKLTDYALAADQQQYLTLMQDPKTVQLISRMEDIINQLFEGKITNGVLKAQEYTQITNQTINVMILIVLISLLVAVALGIVIAGAINKPVTELVDVAGKIAAGDLDVTIETKNKDELGTLMQAFDKMAGNTNDLIANINSASEQVAAGSRQVSISSQALSQGSAEQASSLEEITASITQIAAQTKQNAANANQANDLAMTAKDSAIEGNLQMKDMLKAMDEINESSANISKIIKVIDEIAFQTNILALNAAVEAARAGQHGKGFAVVAEEVRNLAARSANAAKETTALIAGSVKKVETGTKFANDTAQALNRIVEKVGAATNLVAEIAAASNQQASAITQINQGIEQVSQVTQSNTATAEESAAASEELTSQAEMLRNMVGRFKIKRNGLTSAQLKTLNPDVLKALEDLAAKQNLSGNLKGAALGETVVPAAKAPIKIHLNDSDYGKY